MTLCICMQYYHNLNKYLPAYKIGSGDITWLEFIKYIALKKKPLLIAVGASSFNDVDRVLKLVYKINRKICLMQCNTNYTGSSENFKYINITGDNIQTNPIISFISILYIIIF